MSGCVYRLEILKTGATWYCLRWFGLPLVILNCKRPPVVVHNVTRPHGPYKNSPDLCLSFPENNLSGELIFRVKNRFCVVMFLSSVCPYMILFLYFYIFLLVFIPSFSFSAFFFSILLSHF